MIAEAVATTARRIRGPVISVALVGSITTGEFNRRLPISDVDVFLVVEDSTPGSIQERLQRQLVRRFEAACPGWRFGVRIRERSELPEFDSHMWSWGYDLRRFVRTVAGDDVSSFLGPRPPVTATRLFRNLLERSWCDVLYLTTTRSPAERLALAARSVLDLVTLALLLEGQSAGTHWERVQAVSRGALGPRLVRRSALMTECWHIKTGTGRGRVRGSLTHGLIDISDELTSRLASRLWPSKRMRSELGAWFPLTDLVRGIPQLQHRAAGLLLHLNRIPAPGTPGAVAAAVFLVAAGRAAWHSLGCSADCQHMKKQLATANEALRMLSPAVACTAGDLLRMRREFAALRLARCPAARRDLARHLMRVASVSV